MRGEYRGAEMLSNSFIFLEGIGVARERWLWCNGVKSWDDFIDADHVPGISVARKAKANSRLNDAKDRLREGDATHFSSLLRQRDHWRCYDDFRDRAIFLDIETTGISRRSLVTVVGMHDGRRTHTLVRGQGLTGEHLEAVLERAGIIVTFNGASFDLPILDARFPGAVPRVPHLDLKHLLRRLGMTGGLKAIERDMGIERDLRVQYLTGQDAVYLWRLWEKKGSWNSLKALKEYNSEDCENLRVIADRACAEMKSKLMGAYTVTR
ncbi:MAG: ribonuclease H-like domain-containing protein [Methanobacteriota archaeon]|nr:MAG: ribonuclease H-like domain-containing protein [Euryarchaeota archaeon]